MSSVTITIRYSHSSPFVQLPPSTSKLIFRSLIISKKPCMSGGDEPGVWSGSAWTTTRKPSSSVIHGRLSAPTPCVLNHDTVSANAVLEPWTGYQTVCGIHLWMKAVGCPSILLSTASPPPNRTASCISCLSFSLRCAHTRAQRSSVNGGPYPWSPPHAFLSVKECLDCYRSNIPRFLWTRTRDEVVQLLPDTKVCPNGSASLTVAFLS
jgi:hypothetical protein